MWGAEAGEVRAEQVGTGGRSLEGQLGSGEAEVERGLCLWQLGGESDLRLGGVGPDGKGRGQTGSSAPLPRPPFPLCPRTNPNPCTPAN